jgi:hypothetical protein
MSPLLKNQISEPHDVLNTSSPPERTPFTLALSVWRGRLGGAPGILDLARAI